MNTFILDNFHSFVFVVVFNRKIKKNIHTD